MDPRLFKTVLVVGCVFASLLCSRVFSQEPASPAAEPKKELKLEPIKLADPDLSKGLPLMQALKNRATVRNISSKELSPQQLSEILWAANGVNREDGKRTAPAAINKQFVDLYAVTPKGIYIFDATKSELKPVAEGDFRKQIVRQDYSQSAPLNLVFVADPNKYAKTPPTTESGKEDLLINAAIAAGCQTQNVALYCTGENLGATVIGSINRVGFAKCVKLPSDHKVICGLTVGCRKQ